jgi:hypothetical protein
VGHRTRVLAGVVVGILILTASLTAQRPRPVTPPPPVPPPPQAKPADPPPRLAEPARLPEPVKPPAPPPDEAERVLLQNPVFALLRDVDPEGYAMALKVLRDAIVEKPAPGVVAARSQEIFQSRLSRYVLGGSDAAVAGYFRALVTQLEQLGRTNPAACVAMAVGTSAASSKESMSVALGMMPALFELLESNRGRTPSVVTNADRESAEAAIFGVLMSTSPSERDLEILGTRPPAERDYARYCELNVSLMKLITQFPLAEAAPLLRVFASADSSPDPAPDPAPKVSATAATLLRLPLFYSLQAVDPEGFEIAAGIVAEAGGTPRPGELMEMTRTALEARARRWVQQATDAGVIAYYTAFVERMAVYGKVSATACYVMGAGMPAMADPPATPEVTEATKASLIAMLFLLESAKGRSPVALTDGDARNMRSRLAKVVESLGVTKRDQEILADDFPLLPDHPRSCELHMQLYRRILALPAAEAAGILRFLAWQG